MFFFSIGVPVSSLVPSLHKCDLFMYNKILVYLYCNFLFHRSSYTSCGSETKLSS